MGNSAIEKQFKTKAIHSLVPNGVYHADADGNILEWLTPDITQPTESEINTKVAELQTDFDAQAYARARRPLYPDIGDQLDDLYKQGAFSSAMAAKIKKVKDDNPKG